MKKLKDEDKHFMLANLDYAVLGSMKYRFWKAKLWEDMAQNYAEMVSRFMSSAKCSIN